MFKIHRNKHGKELRVILNARTLLIISTRGMIGEESSNEDLWFDGWRIGFTPISRFIRKIGFYLFIATKE